ncbi:hypothetical protein [Streptococcus canis]|uniref:hypothetical protein n=1 Tax=Streptococcus canis TaxID=1329 RepID=UPI0013DBFEE7
MKESLNVDKRDNLKHHLAWFGTLVSLLRSSVLRLSWLPSDSGSQRKRCLPDWGSSYYSPIDKKRPTGISYS